MPAILYSWPQRICREKSRTPQHHYLIWPRWKCCSVVGQCYERHRHDELLRFLRRLDHEFPGKIGLHLVLDNYIAHKHPNVRAWLERHSRFVCRYVPTNSSWLNLVERWFGESTRKRIRRGSFGRVAGLQQAIMEFSRPGTKTRGLSSTRVSIEQKFSIDWRRGVRSLRVT